MSAAPSSQRPVQNGTDLSRPGDAVVTQVSDPTYYGALSLDVYPKSLTALDAAMVSTAGVVRATVYIDETGMVDAVRAVEAGSVEAESAVRALVLRTRFTPAYKDGRVVKARLTVALR